ncbi:Flp pilus assembly protein CpaB [Sphingobium sufflavum]|uniref:Flp pilus assembly protein CpaB n=1 Tax=Sphingobium sufflavum TaxID=1129547 RepID=UPI001F1D535F|nr:Flp pilus assembly protein CpaB [Sphingobium sufflavum]MCE7795850.1 Flp pilus assembly protein CpaB [Sphingobium sufflavum]
MEPKKIALLVGALVIAIAAAFLARSMFLGAPAPQADAAAMPQQQLQKVLVATKQLPVGTIIGPEEFRYQPWPEELIENAYFIEGKADQSKLVGSVVRTAISAGQPVTQGALIQPGDRGFLAAALAPGMRAVTLPVQMQASVAGFIFPGDRVDMMLTQTVAGGGDGPPLKVSETVLRNLRVLATDQRTNPLGEDGRPVVAGYSNVTIEVTPRMAEKITVAQTLGAISLSLRSLADSTSDLEAALASGEVQAPKGNDPTAEKEMLASLANRPMDRGRTFSTGGDVSKFQRRTVPAKPADPAAAMAASAAKGEVVRVARGTSVTPVPVGSK